MIMFIHRSRATFIIKGGEAKINQSPNMWTSTHVAVWKCEQSLRHWHGRLYRLDGIEQTNLKTPVRLPTRCGIRYAKIMWQDYFNLNKRKHLQSIQLMHQDAKKYWITRWTNACHTILIQKTYDNMVNNPRHTVDCLPKTEFMQITTAVTEAPTFSVIFASLLSIFDFHFVGHIMLVFFVAGRGWWHWGRRRRRRRRIWRWWYWSVCCCTVFILEWFQSTVNSI